MNRRGELERAVAKARIGAELQRLLTQAAGGAARAIVRGGVDRAVKYDVTVTREDNLWVVGVSHQRVHQLLRAP